MKVLILVHFSSLHLWLIVFGRGLNDYMRCECFVKEDSRPIVQDL
ncbi:hypothetical protein KP509_1Z066800 [Ceratopteris richardii]|nr:hypothetical protein KP509_1Z066800 [Ceratopteris richardii]